MLPTCYLDVSAGSYPARQDPLFKVVVFHRLIDCPANCCAAGSKIVCGA